MELSATYEVPRPDCDRCAGWRTVIHDDKVLSPCPACRANEFDAWRAAGNQVPARIPAP